MTVTLDSIREAADANYGSYSIALEVDENDQPVPGKVVKLLNPLRISADKRKKMSELQKALSEEGADQVAVLRDLITVVAEKPTQAKALITAIGDDLAVLVETFKAYGEATQAGEA